LMLDKTLEKTLESPERHHTIGRLTPLRNGQFKAVFSRMFHAIARCSSYRKPPLLSSG
jgi:hypothetical protein